VRMVFSSPLDSAMRYRADNIQVGKDLKDNSTDCDVVAEAFLKKGLGDLSDLARSRRPGRILRVLKDKILSEATRPPATLGRLSNNSMAKHDGLSRATVQRIWSTNDTKPHRTRLCKLSSGEQYGAKFSGVIGLIFSLQTRRWCSAAMRKVSVRRCSAFDPDCP
jgi:hypothetical protein